MRRGPLGRGSPLTLNDRVSGPRARCARAPVPRVRRHGCAGGRAGRPKRLRGRHPSRCRDPSKRVLNPPLGEEGRILGNKHRRIFFRSLRPRGVGLVLASPPPLPPPFPPPRRPQGFSTFHYLCNKSPTGEPGREPPYLLLRERRGKLSSPHDY